MLGKEKCINQEIADSPISTEPRKGTDGQICILIADLSNVAYF